ncbi:MAG: IS66 family transposase, partial [Steroidobacteraceae bacterium]
MPLDPASLPRDPDRLIEMVVELDGENGRLRAMLETARRMLFGARSERFESDAAQLALDLQDTSTAPVETMPVKPRREKPATKPKPTRNIGGLPKHLPREDVVIEPGIDCCPCCHGALHRIGEDVSEMLDVVPAVIRVKRIRRPRYGCRSCESAVVQAPAPPRPVEGGLPTSALLAHIAAAKFAWHLPLHRQAQMLAGHGIALDRSTLVRWIERAAWWLKPLHALLTSTV